MNVEQKNVGGIVLESLRIFREHVHNLIWLIITERDKHLALVYKHPVKLYQRGVPQADAVMVQGEKVLVLTYAKEYAFATGLFVRPIFNERLQHSKGNAVELSKLCLTDQEAVLRGIVYSAAWSWERPAELDLLLKTRHENGQK